MRHKAEYMDLIVRYGLIESHVCLNLQSPNAGNPPNERASIKKNKNKNEKKAQNKGAPHEANINPDNQSHAGTTKLSIRPITPPIRYGRSQLFRQVLPPPPCIQTGPLARKLFRWNCYQPGHKFEECKELGNTFCYNCSNHNVTTLTTLILTITLTIKGKPLRVIVDFGSNRSFLGQPGIQLNEQLCLPITRIISGQVNSSFRQFEAVNEQLASSALTGCRIVEEPQTVVATEISGPYPRTASSYEYISVMQNLFTKWLDFAHYDVLLAPKSATLLKNSCAGNTTSTMPPPHLRFSKFWLQSQS